MRKEEEKEDEERPDSQAVRQSMQCSEEGSQADRYRCGVGPKSPGATPLSSGNAATI